MRGSEWALHIPHLPLAGLYAVLAWYCDKIVPDSSGTPLPPYFIFLPAYWLGRPIHHAENSPAAHPAGLRGLHHRLRGAFSLPASPLHGDDSGRHRHAPEAGEGDTQPADPSARAAVEIRGLRKAFRGGTVAVKGLDLTIYHDQITALLGHNGAGKSTTIAMLTGLVPPSSGDVFVLGKSVRDELAAVRTVCGICPQQNVLFPRLTVLEHLRFFAVLKGVPARHVALAALRRIAALNLLEKQHTQAHALSGGMKRRLQLAMALVGPSKVVLCDEPTSGMDPLNRRATWEMLKAARRGRAILLTTHYLDEARRAPRRP